MSVALRILGRLLFHRPLVPVLLVLIYLVCVLLLATVETNKGGGLAAAILGAFAAGGLSALLTERIARYSFAAGSLGLPDHARRMRMAQGWFLVLFVAGPAVGAGIFGVSLLAATAILCTATALGIALTTFGAWWMIVAFFATRWLSPGEWIALPAVQAVCTAAAVWMISRWFQLPVRAESAGGLAPSVLADAKREATAVPEDPTALLSLDEHAGKAPTSDAPIVQVREDLVSGRNLASVLALGLGYPIVIAWRLMLYGFGVATFILLAWHVLHGHRSEVLGYGVITFGCCATIVGRLNHILQRWMRTSTEQSLLCLAPQWPAPRLIKLALLQSVFLVQRGSIAVWAASSALVAFLGWIDKSYLLISAMAVLATSLAFSGALFAVLARRRIGGWHLSTVALVILVPAGALIVSLDNSLSRSSLGYGMALMLVPPALALLWYALAPLRLPLDVDPRAIRANL